MQRAASRRTALLWQCTRNIQRPCSNQNSPERSRRRGPNTAAHHNPKLARLVDQVYDTLLDADAWPRALIVIADAPESDA
jgi:hypothetical protein